VTDEAAPPTAAHARPVAGLPLQTLTARADELARAWAVALILARPPSEIADVPLEDLARDAPELCVQVLHALASDAELARLTGTDAPGGRGREEARAAGLARLAGARDIRSAVAAVEALRGVLWEATLAELREPVFDRSRAHLLADLADRLAHVCAMTLTVALPETLAGEGRSPSRGEVSVAGAAGVAQPRTYAPSVRAERQQQPAGPFAAAGGRQAPGDGAPPSGEPAAPVRSPASAGRDGAGLERDAHGEEVVIIDERPRASAPSRVVVARERRARTPAHAAVAATRAWRPPEQIEIRDERTGEGPAAWIRSIGRELERFTEAARPFAVLLVELMDLEPLRRGEQPGELAELSGQVQATLESELRAIAGPAAGSLTRESSGRLWLIAPGIGPLRVGALAEQIAGAVRRSVGYRGRALEVAVGTAVCPDDGLEAAALAAHADVALYAARAESSARGDAAR
jgi:GGDEF domain-containing protein